MPFADPERQRTAKREAAGRRRARERAVVDPQPIADAAAYPDAPALTHVLSRAGVAVWRSEPQLLPEVGPAQRLVVRLEITDAEPEAVDPGA